jgi:hypothetical protein
MVFNRAPDISISSITASFVLVVRNFVRIVFKPYETFRKVAGEKDAVQVVLILLLVYAYFLYASVMRTGSFHPLILTQYSGVSFGMFLVTFALTIFFFYGIGRIQKKRLSLQSLITLFSYSLIPTLLWFFITSTLFYLIPPPRTLSPQGKIFSVIFIVFSLTMLYWRAILLYLSLRFTFKVHFYTILMYIALFLAWLLPYSYIMYMLHIFRIPFI